MPRAEAEERKKKPEGEDDEMKGYEDEEPVTRGALKAALDSLTDKVYTHIDDIYDDMKDMRKQHLWTMRETVVAQRHAAGLIEVMVGWLEDDEKCPEKQRNEFIEWCIH